MNATYDIAASLLRNLHLTSDNAEMEECYWLCANKNLLSSLECKDPQIICGRRGTGKTTLLKSFVYNINEIKKDVSTHALYFVMQNMIPTLEEIDTFESNKNGLVLFVFINLIEQLCVKLSSIYDSRKNMIDEYKNNDFIKRYTLLSDKIELYKSQLLGAEIAINQSEVEKSSKILNNNNSMGINAAVKIIGGKVENSTEEQKHSKSEKVISISGNIKFLIHTKEIHENLLGMIDNLGIKHLYLCLDEYSEIDKLYYYSIQPGVAQLIKQVFFKSNCFSVKIATVWSKTKLKSKGSNFCEGLEIGEDIFYGPNLDIMFFESNQDIIAYFKKILVNSYLMDKTNGNPDEDTLADYFEKYLFGEIGLKHLVCGSQGVSRSFVELVKKYIETFLSLRNGPLKLYRVFDIIINQYDEKVSLNIPKYSLCSIINDYVEKNKCRYFLIKSEDYERCKLLIKYLSSCGFIMSVSSHNTDRTIRNNYRLFLVNYGNYIELLTENSYKLSRKELTKDASFSDEGLLIPEYDPNLFTNPEKYTIKIPDAIEREVYCPHCNTIIKNSNKEMVIDCPNCNEKIIKYTLPL